MRKTIVLLAAGLLAAATPAAAQNWLESKMAASICNSKAAPAEGGDRLTKRLALTTDAQKAALKDLSDASAAAAASMKTALCAEKPDLATATGRMAFSEKITQARLDGIKAIEPKLDAFYATLDDKQKKAFDTGGKVGGFFDWWKGQ